MIYVNDVLQYLDYIEIVIYVYVNKFSYKNYYSCFYFFVYVLFKMYYFKDYEIYVDLWCWYNVCFIQKF